MSASAARGPLFVATFVLAGLLVGCAGTQRTSNGGPAQEQAASVDVSQSDIRAYVRRELQTLRDEVERGLRRTSDDTTRMHLEDVLVRIERILEGEDDSDE